MKSKAGHPSVPSGTLLGLLWFMGFDAVKRNVLHYLSFRWCVTYFLMLCSRFRGSEQIKKESCTENLIKMTVN